MLSVAIVYHSSHYLFAVCHRMPQNVILDFWTIRGIVMIAGVYKILAGPKLPRPRVPSEPRNNNHEEGAD